MCFISLRPISSAIDIKRVKNNEFERKDLNCQVEKKKNKGLYNWRYLNQEYYYQEI